MSGGLLRGALVAAVVYGVAVAILLLPAGATNPGEDNTGTYVIVILASLLAAAAGAAAGTWQARAGGVLAAVPAMAAGFAGAVIVGLLLTAAGGGATSALGDALIYLAHLLGAAAGALGYGRRMMGTVRK
jgi:hypothetical protein